MGESLLLILIIGFPLAILMMVFFSIKSLGKFTSESFIGAFFSAGGFVFVAFFIRIMFSDNDLKHLITPSYILLFLFWLWNIYKLIFSKRKGEDNNATQVTKSTITKEDIQRQINKNKGFIGNLSNEDMVDTDIDNIFENAMKPLTEKEKRIARVKKERESLHKKL